MMRTSIIMATVCLALASCTKVMEPLPGTDAHEEAQSPVTFSVEGTQIETRATSASDATIGTAAGDIQILVFSGNNLISYGKNTPSARSVTVSVRNGSVECYAVINAPDLSAVATKSQLLSRTVSLLDNTTSKMLMLGSTTKTVSGATSIQIPVKRFLAKVEIDKIDAALTTPALKSQDLTINDITLLNVVGRTSYSFAGNASIAYNEGKHTVSGADALTYDEVGAKIQTGGKVTPHTVPHYFYCCPSTASAASTTRLSIKATLGSIPYYYTVEIPQPKANTLYKITNLKITGPGADNPNDIISKSSISFTITVTDWSTGFSKEVVY